MKIIFCIVVLACVFAVISCNSKEQKKESTKVESTEEKTVTAEDKSGIVYNSELLLKDTVVDIDGNVYHTVQIGEQIWMVENFKSTHFRNGDEIDNITDNLDWLNLTSSAYCNYDNDTTNVKTYGRLYNWYAVTDKRNICPEGWHIPSYEEWAILIDFLGGKEFAGSKMKETTMAHWIYDLNTRSDNSSGFTGLPGGLRSDNGIFFAKKGSGLYWSSTELDKKFACLIFLGSYDNDAVEIMSMGKFEGVSVRCVKD